ncbi:hypothetical protein SR02_002626 [Salmonella enterica subsp. arizonae]|nr:hypothetical protein [Salmonella enterica subsp. arizonae]
MSVIVREHPAKSGDYWYTFRYTVECIPKSVYQFMKERPTKEIAMRKARLPSFTLSWSSTSISFSLSAHGASSLPDWSSHCCDISAFMGNRKSGSFPLFHLCIICAV